MPLPLFSRWLAATTRAAARQRATQRVVESYPPLAFAHRRAWPSRLGSWLGASGWRASGNELASPFGRRGRTEALVAARLDFAEVLFDVRTAGATEALDRIARARSLHELWHLREEVFSRVACCHDQTEAERRLAELDRHFPRRTRAAAFMATPAADSATVPGP
jgi:hypothetical protein